MELKYAIALYICAGVAAVFVIAAFINIRFKRKYKKGKKTYLPDYIKDDPKFKSKMFWYTVLKYVLIVLIIVSLLLSGFLMARPYKTESKELANYNRDIILCMDFLPNGFTGGFKGVQMKNTAIYDADQFAGSVTPTAEPEKPVETEKPAAATEKPAEATEKPAKSKGCGGVILSCAAPVLLAAAAFVLRKKNR